jgi:hypothetical protein
VDPVKDSIRRALKNLLEIFSFDDDLRSEIARRLTYDDDDDHGHDHDRANGRSERTGSIY